MNAIGEYFVELDKFLVDESLNIASPSPSPSSINQQKKSASSPKLSFSTPPSPLPNNAVSLIKRADSVSTKKATSADKKPKQESNKYRTAKETNEKSRTKSSFSSASSSLTASSGESLSSSSSDDELSSDKILLDESPPVERNRLKQSNKKQINSKTHKRTQTDRSSTYYQRESIDGQQNDCLKFIGYEINNRLFLNIFFVM